MKNWVLTLTILMTFVHAQAENEKGNGGDAYRIGEKVYAFDLVENGLETNPYFAPQTEPDADTLAILGAKVPVTQTFPNALIAKKMSEIKNANLLYYTMLKLAMQHYTYRFVNTELEDVNDAVSVVKLNTKNLLQAAVRDGDTIRFSNPILKQMGSKNQTALFFHELNYAMQMGWNINYRLYLIADSDAARILTAKIFAGPITSDDLETVLFSSLTDYKNLKETYSLDKKYTVYPKYFYRFVDVDKHALMMGILKGASTRNSIDLPYTISAYETMTEAGGYLLRIKETQ